jgi:hypothetical protein
MPSYIQKRLKVAKKVLSFGNGKQRAKENVFSLLSEKVECLNCGKIGHKNCHCKSTL